MGGYWRRAGDCGAAHLRLASADVKIGMPIARTLGNCLPIAICGVGGVIWRSTCRHMILTAELLSADQALASGFVHDVLKTAPLCWHAPPPWPSV